MRQNMEELMHDELITLCNKLTKNQTDVFAQYLAKSRKLDKVRKHLTKRTRYDEVARYAHARHMEHLGNLRMQLRGLLDDSEYRHAVVRARYQRNRRRRRNEKRRR